VYEGRWVVSRAWIVQYTGAAVSTVARWYALRHEQPEGLRHPEVVCTVGRVKYFDQQAVEAFWGPGGRMSARACSDPGGAVATGREHVEVGPAGSSVSRPWQWPFKRCGLPAGTAAGWPLNWRVSTGGVARTWQRAVNEAREQYEAEHEQGAAGAAS
jgi:hypothetical protein